MSATVLIVDDDPVVRDMYTLALQRDGHAVVTAADGVAGLDLASRRRPKVILLDVRMPRLDGLEMLRQVTANPDLHEIPVVMLSNFDDPALMRQSLSLGAKEYLLKVSTDPRKLRETVTRWVDGSGDTSG